MSATRLLLRPNKAAIGRAVLARRNGTVPTLPSCSPFPYYCAALARRIGTVPAISSCSPFPFPYRRRNGTAPALLSVGLRHMSSNGRRPEAEGIPYTGGLDKTINEILGSELDNIQSQEHRISLLKRENEKLIGEIEKMHNEFRSDMDKAAARRLDLNLERGRIRDELARRHAEIANLITKLDLD